MLRPILFAAFAALVVPASASAAPFGELPFSAADTGATCLRATGAPGELARSTRSGTRLLSVGAGGIAETDLVATGAPQGECAQVAASPSGAGVIAQSGSGLWVATREPGTPPAPWTKPAKLALEATRAAVAVTDSGAAIVAWLEPGASGRFDVRAMRRPAGGQFGAAETLGSARSESEFAFEGSVRAAIAASGEAFVLWTQPPAGSDSEQMPVDVAIAPAGGPFGSAQRVGLTHASSVPALAAGPDGRALVALATLTQLQVAERAPGGAFAAPTRLASFKEPFVAIPAAAMGPGGAAIVGWYGLFSQGVGAAARAAAGPFGAPVALAAPAGTPGLDDSLLTLLSAFGLGALGPSGAEGLAPDREGGNLRAALTRDGRALLSWNTYLGVPRAASFPLAGGHLDRFALGAGVREAGSVTPLITASGAAAVAWTDNQSGREGRVHVAVEGFTAAPDAPAPRVTLGSPRHVVLKPEQALRLPVTCSAACEVRVDLPDQFATTTYVSLSRAGTRTVTLAPAFTPIAPVRRGPVRVRVRFAAPGARAGSERIENVRLQRERSSPAPKVLGLKAVRHGSRVDVSWRSDRRAEADAFAVVGVPSRTLAVEGLVAAEARARGERSFTARLTGAKEVRYVFVFTGSGGSIGAPYVAKVR